MTDPQPDDPLARVREGYDLWAEVYDHDANPLIGLEQPLVRDSIGEIRGRHVLDLGCGTGRHTEWIARSDPARLVAVDFSPGMLAEARRKVDSPRVEFVQHDLHEPLPLEDATFDLVVSGLVLEHLRDLRAFFGEVRRVVRPHGRAVVSAMHPAMWERGSRARFRDPATGRRVAPGSLSHSLDDFVTAALDAGLGFEAIEERAPDAGFATRFPRAAKYVGVPMLVVLVLRA